MKGSGPACLLVSLAVMAGGQAVFPPASTIWCNNELAFPAKSNRWTMLCGCLLKAERSHLGTAVMNDCEGHQRSFSVRPSERPLHLQDRVLASGWHQAIGEGPVSHEAKWHSRPGAAGQSKTTQPSSDDVWNHGDLSPVCKL